MTVSTLEAPGQVSAPELQSEKATAPRARSAAGTPAGAPSRTVPTRPLRRDGRQTGPRARPARPLETPVITRSGAPSPRSCRVDAGPRPVLRQAQWRLTERAIAMVLVTGLVIVTAALAVVGLTALRVTGDRYQAQDMTRVASAPLSQP